MFFRNKKLRAEKEDRHYVYMAAFRPLFVYKEEKDRGLVHTKEHENKMNQMEIAYERYLKSIAKEKGYITFKDDNGFLVPAKLIEINY